MSKLDRMGRDMREIMETAWSLQDLGAKLEILSGPLTGVYDPRGMGKMFFALLAGFAELEREMMTERTRDGLAQAAAEGRHGGRRPVISRDMMRIALGRRADGESVTSIARGLPYKTAGGQERTVSRRTLYNAFRAMTPNRPPGPHSRTQPDGPPSRLQDPLIVAFGLTLAGPQMKEPRDARQASQGSSRSTRRWPPSR
jgi:DNA invertase Pin-like site-specific DNA recombinase